MDQGGLGGGPAGDAAEHRGGHQAGAAGIVEIEQTPDHFARGEKALDALAALVETQQSASTRSPPKVKVMPQVTA